MKSLKIVVAVFLYIALVSLISQNNIAADNEKENSVSNQEQKKPKTKYPGPPADNSRCLVCHANFEDEKLTDSHLKANVGCIVCHLECDSHCVDEDNLTPPDRMFANKGRVRFLCLTCHNWKELIETDKTKADLKDPPEHSSVLAGTNKDGKFCMDCHSEHKLSHRTRIWDKRTGKLVYKDSTPIMLKKQNEDN